MIVQHRRRIMVEEKKTFPRVHIVLRIPAFEQAVCTEKGEKMAESISWQSFCCLPRKKALLSKRSPSCFVRIVAAIQVRAEKREPPTIEPVSRVTAAAFRAFRQAFLYAITFTVFRYEQERRIEPPFYLRRKKISFQKKD